MPNNYFKFKQFTILQDKTAMKVGTDGVLLGAWANCNQATKILDIGTGTGLIALMLAQKSPAIIDAIEINDLAAEQARKNFENSPWSNRLKAINNSLQGFSPDNDGKYDLIVSNPPYFKNSLKAPDKRRSIARHDHLLSFSDLFHGVNKLLSKDGRFSLIIPFSEYESILSLAAKYNLLPLLILFIKPTPVKDIKRVLIEFTYLPGLKQSVNTLIIESSGRHNFSKEYIELTKDFYLAF